jgi:hypothetical protein
MFSNISSIGIQGNIIFILFLGGNLMIFLESESEED